eukprot:9598429-Lingulodinium_polyedra.AAC.1
MALTRFATKVRPFWLPTGTDSSKDARRALGSTSSGSEVGGPTAASCLCRVGAGGRRVGSPTAARCLWSK